MTDKKKEYISKNFQLSEQIIADIEYLCDDMLGTDKYAIWMAKEAKKDVTILDYPRLRYILDWALGAKPKPDILSFDFKSAYKASQDFHNTLKQENLNSKDSEERIDKRRILFRCSDGNHFFYSLKYNELKREGELMGNCVGDESYVNRLRKGQIMIVSLRDKSNFPHVTCEINTRTGVTLQIEGKKRKVKNIETKQPLDKYQNFICEFALWSSGDSFSDEIKNELNRLMKIDTKKK